ncbi:aldose epimerase family protein [Reichenbachiella ulvae]|uniref:Aldose 1-epimerase n=1 Tax=Reichenbachiella ulvae TaxID=2980104 RepID=A0ABT3CUF7_9BACT|nr:aldose epimerase family protein [Reichenbachiella ulvae]MCV9387335.1 galactose mutarotase [Reichenbachiella ulvae]
MRVDKVDIEKEFFGFIEGQPVYLYTLKAGHMALSVMNYGATITAIEVPDRNGQMHSVVAGFSTLEKYLQPHPYMGVIVGRFANRIADGRFTLDGKEYQLSINDSPNHLHGGDSGFDKKVWMAEDPMIGPDHCAIAFTTSSADGEEGYPGNLSIRVVYKVTEQNEVEISYHAITDKATPISLTNHSYFNLSGFQKSRILDHELSINSAFFTEKNENNTSTGRLIKCADTAQDFRLPKKLGKDIDQLVSDRGYDHNHVIEGHGFRSVAQLVDPYSGRMLEVHSDMPGAQIYTSNWWDATLIGSQGIPYEKHGAIAIETQQFPDAPNHTNFPNAILRPGETYESKTRFSFSCQAD